MEAFHGDECGVLHDQHGRVREEVRPLSVRGRAIRHDNFSAEKRVTATGGPRGGTASARPPSGATVKDTLGRYAARGIRDLRPDSYAFVMATGIMALAASQAELVSVSWALFQIARAAYAGLWLLTLARLAFHARRMVADLISPTRSAGVLTVVAATCVLGSLYILLARDRGTAFFLWTLGAVLWLMLMYTFFAAAMVREPKPALTSGLDGSWLMVVVATQSVSLLGTLVVSGWGPERPLGLFVTLALYLLGCALYVPIIVMILYRLLFLQVTPADLSPPYWISMGSLAISTLAGAVLAGAAPGEAGLREVLPVLRALTLALWAMGTWWIPLLVFLGAWKHLLWGVPLTYTSEYWAMIFPLGMYTASTFELAQVTGMIFLGGIAHVFIYAALAGWCWAFVGLVRGLAMSAVALVQGGS